MMFSSQVMLIQIYLLYLYSDIELYVFLNFTNNLPKNIAFTLEKGATNFLDLTIERKHA